MATRRTKPLRVVALFVFTAAVLAGSVARAYLDAPVEKLTLPQLLNEFKSVQVVKATRVDLERGVVIWSPVDSLRGDKGQPVRHLLKLRGKVPPALGGLKEGDEAVLFSLDGWGRGVVRAAGCWYVVGYEADHDVWRIAYTDRHYDFNVCFAGTPDELVAAARKLLAGEEVTVPCRAKAQDDATQAVRYSMKRPKEKAVVTPATTQPATRPQ